MRRLVKNLSGNAQSLQKVAELGVERGKLKLATNPKLGVVPSLSLSPATELLIRRPHSAQPADKHRTQN